MYSTIKDVNIAPKVVKIVVVQYTYDYYFCKISVVLKYSKINFI